jgi:hypothetical protein
VERVVPNDPSGRMRALVCFVRAPLFPHILAAQVASSGGGPSRRQAARWAGICVFILPHRGVVVLLDLGDLRCIDGMAYLVCGTPPGSGCLSAGFPSDVEIALDFVKTLLKVVACPKSDRFLFSRSLYVPNPLHPGCPDKSSEQQLQSDHALRRMLILRGCLGCFGSCSAGDGQAAAIAPRNSLEDFGLTFYAAASATAATAKLSCLRYRRSSRGPIRRLHWFRPSEPSHSAMSLQPREIGAQSSITTVIPGLAVHKACRQDMLRGTSMRHACAVRDIPLATRLSSHQFIRHMSPFLPRVFPFMNAMSRHLENECQSLCVGRSRQIGLQITSSLRAAYLHLPRSPRKSRPILNIG